MLALIRPENLRIEIGERETYGNTLRFGAVKNLSAGFVASGGYVYNTHPLCPVVTLGYTEGIAMRQSFRFSDITHYRAIFPYDHILVEDGKDVDIQRDGRAKRNYIGILEDNALLYLHSRSTRREAAYTLKYFGAKHVICFDNSLLEIGGAQLSEGRSDVNIAVEEYYAYDSPIIVLDPAHGGTDLGETNGLLYEKEIVLEVTKYAFSYLKNNYTGTFLITRARDINPPQEDRVALSRCLDADLVLNIHSGTGGSGIATFVRRDTPTEASVATQNVLHASLVRNSKYPDRGKMRGDFFHLVYSSDVKRQVHVEIPSVVHDLRLVNTPEFIPHMGMSLAKAIVETMGLKQKGPEPVAPKPKLFRVQVGAFRNKDNAIKLMNQLRSNGYDSFITDEQ